MIDIAPRLCDVALKGPKGCAKPSRGHAVKRKLYSPEAVLHILGEDGALVQEATIEEIWAPHATRLEIVVLDEAWGTATSSPVPDATFIDLDDLGPLGGTSSLHSAILREAQQHELQLAASPAAAPQGRTHAQPDALDSDFGNLDWLINFKVDSVFEPKKAKAKPGSPKDDAATAPSAAPANPHPQAHRYSGPGKPPFTYTELIELALKDKGKLTVKEIYQWITKHFPFYQASDERWKNSVRHNLSINPHFRKESKAPQGAGHLWVVMDNNNKVKNSWVSTQSATSRQSNRWWSERVSLERSAEEILSGVKREVGVEFLTPMDLDGDLDGDLDAEVLKLETKEEKGFLYGDLTAEQVIAESGLQDELAGLYLLNDMTSTITSDSLFPDDLNFGGLELPLSG
ncbi:uncharacterized protein LOC117644641 [Thrips palmi]|uniref:Uncharacterized protein LOC117644641 n=1 Tax=Thrips palmi TaxID=161013 RepID=A0A6P8YJU6_THRPL|nr:uncharacterized protein LOC117644641 [Thrips palmi]